MEFFNFFVKEKGEDLLFRMIVTHMQCCFMSPAKYNRWTVSLLGMKWKISIPVVEKIIKPYLATGPSFGILVSKKDIDNLIKNKTCDVSWNFGVGAELFSHLQVGVSYGLGLNNSIEVGKLVDNQSLIEGKANNWTITAAYLF